jgi:hypothetical protein
MAHVPGFEFDLFISYTHNDNALGWVDQFHERLESWLKHRRGRLALSVWRDREQTGNTVFDLAIENKIKSSALFFALNSRNFLKSAYCTKELALFQRYHGDRPLSASSRAFSTFCSTTFRTRSGRKACAAPAACRCTTPKKANWVISPPPMIRVLKSNCAPSSMRWKKRSTLFPKRPTTILAR